MSMSRREAIGLSGATLAGLSLATLTGDRLQAQRPPRRRHRGRIRWSSARCARASRHRCRSTRTAPPPSTRRARPDRSPIR